MGSDAHKRCIHTAESMDATGARVRDAVTAGNMRANQQPEDRGVRPLRRLEQDESELLNSTREMALKFLPFYSHMMYRVRPVAVDEEPTILPDGTPQWEMRAAISRDWRLMLNFDWMRYEFEQGYANNKDRVAKAMAEQGVTPTDEAVRRGCDTATSVQLGKVLLHEMGHAMYNTWEVAEQRKLNGETLNRAEDAVINNALRVLGHGKAPLENKDINGEFLPNAVYGGTVECDDPGHSWHYIDPVTGEKSSRCSYEQTIWHYYERLDKQEKEDSKQGSTGDGDPDDAPDAAKGEAKGDQKGQAGGSQRTEGSPSGSTPGAEGDGDGEGGEGAKPSDACGRKAAEKYEDDPYEKGSISESQKQDSLDVTASELDEWGKENEERAKKAGFGSDSMARKWAQHRRKIDGIRWDALLKKTVRKTVESKKSSRETYTKVRRRDVSNSGILRRGTKAGYMPSIAAAVDTSGSMSPDDLFAAYNSVYSVIKRTGITHLDAFAVDSEAKTKPIAIKKAEDLAPLLRGGGGTDMCAGIEVAAQAGKDVCIVFTDGVVPWGKMAQRPSHIKKMDVIIGIIAANDDECARLAADVPSWMSTVKINKELLDENREKKTPKGGYLG